MITKLLNHNYIKSRELFNIEYKNFLFIIDYYKNMWKSDFVDLFSASTFSNVVPEVISESDIKDIISLGYKYNQYPSPEGNPELLERFNSYLSKIYSLSFKREEMMVCQGTMQAIDALSSIIAGDIVLVMDSTVTFAKALPTLNGAKVVLVNTNKGIIDVDDLQSKIRKYGKENIKYLYINYPNNPTGSQLTLKQFKRLVEIANKEDVLIVHDHDICFTSHSSNKPVISIFNISDAITNAIEIYTFSKEFGLSGLRVGIIVGNQNIIDMIKYHNYERDIMIPQLNQKIAELALDKISPQDVSELIKDSMRSLINGFEDLGWNKIDKPDAGISFLIKVPESFILAFREKAGELFAFFLIKNFGVGVGPAIVNNRDYTDYIRILSMEPSNKCKGVFKKMKGIVTPSMEVPSGIYKEYEDILILANSQNIR